MAYGSFGISTNNQYISGRIDWASSADISTNSSTVNVTMYLSRTNSGFTTKGTGTFNIVVNGTTLSSGSKSFVISQNSNTIMASGSVPVSHTADGSKAITISWSGSSDVFNVTSGSGNATLDTIPRSSSLANSPDWTAGTQSLAISINRASSFTHNLEVWVQHYSGEWRWIGNRTGISDSTSVDFTVDESTKIYQALSGYENRPSKVVLYTYNGGTHIGTTERLGTCYAHPAGYISLSSFTIGETFYSTINNYSWQFTYDVKFEFGTFNKTFYNVGTYNPTTNANPMFTWTQQEKDSMLALIPNSSFGYGTAYVYSYYNGVLIDEAVSSGFTAYVSNSNPIFSNTQIRYEDINPTTLALTSNSQLIIQNKSQLRVWVDSHATPVNGATIANYEVTVNGITQSAPTTGYYNFNEVNSAGDLILAVRAIDSRGNSTVVYKTITIIPYSNPVAILTTARLNSFERETTISLRGNVSQLYINSAYKNSIVSAKYQYKEVGGAYNALTSMTVSGFPSYTTTDVKLDLDNTKAYDIQVVVTDKLGSTTVVRTVSVGKPIIFFDTDKKSTGINMFPKYADSLEVAGNLYLNGLPMKSLTNNTQAIVVTGDWDNVKDTGFYMGTNMGHAPSNVWWYVQVIKHDDLNCVQIAYSLYNQMSYKRVLANGTWSNWASVDGINSTGSTSNGKYIRYENGIQICWHNLRQPHNWYAWGLNNLSGGSPYLYVNEPWYFPATFKSGTFPTVTTSGNILGNGNPETHIAYDSTSTSCNTEHGVIWISGTDPRTSSSNLEFNYHAIGYWY